MDQNSKENEFNLEGQPAPEVMPTPSDTETEAAPEGFSLEADEQPAAAAQNDQVADDSQALSPENTEEEIREQAGEIAHLPEEDKLAHLKEVAQKNSLEKAIRMVKKMNDPWLEDKFHDDLMDDPEWRRKLEELGKIEKL